MTKACRYSCLLMIMLALTVRCLIPAGFMPGEQGGVFSLVICTPTGVETVLVDADYNPVENHGGEQPPPDCPFTPSLAQSLIADAPPVPAAPLDYRLVEPDRPVMRRLAARMPVYRAQGPPAALFI